MIEPNSFRKGTKILIEGEPWEVLEYQHVRYAQGNAVMRTKIRNLLTGAVMERNFKVGEVFEEPDLEYRGTQFLYKEGETYVFMDLKTYDQFPFSEKEVGEAREYLKEGMNVDVVFFSGRLISLRLPKHVELTVIRTEPGLKGDTVSGALKPATLETGKVIQVPLFIKEGDRVRVDTRSGEYIERAE
jgi:elongation factor P